ncbi:N-formylglutamate amidohydrolase [Salibacteraceae bacterium]|nr:N-formylglutamate amidohydrolase [Salibacteraceae bacterium]MDC1220204.1 N-formylglutamate amidohydrolase [bacterium]MDC1304042.1 N-formylglutamate amidohydrolase [Salibacteraceae bacterium]
MIWLLTCEHYSNGLPLKYAEVFVDAVDVLESHRGYDLRVAPMFIRLEPLFDESIHYRYSRLLIEPNRSLSHKHLFSPFTTGFSASEKADLISNYYQPYRKRIEEFIGSYIDQGVFHISVHSFTPKHGNQNRETPVGLKFDSSKSQERNLAVIWKKMLMDIDPSINVRFNYPYRGAADGFTTYLRKCFPKNYVGFELEIRNDQILDLRSSIYQSLANLRGVLE